MGMKCNRDCFHCKYSDCILPDDELTEEEIALSEAMDAEITEKIDMDAVIFTGRRGRPRKVYPKNETELYREERRFYQNGYYRAHREERLAYQKEHDKVYYAKNRDKINARNSERHKRRMQDPVYAEEYRRKARERYARRKNDKHAEV